MAPEYPPRPSIVTNTMLALLTMLVIFHLWLLGTGVRECFRYQSLLHQRIDRAGIGTAIGAELREELRQYLSGSTAQCASLRGTYSTAVEMYLAVILSLLSGVAGSRSR
jgi:hypothetical protein